MTNTERIFQDIKEKVKIAKTDLNRIDQGITNKEDAEKIITTARNAIQDMCYLLNDITDDLEQAEQMGVQEGKINPVNLESFVNTDNAATNVNCNGFDISDNDYVIVIDNPDGYYDYDNDLINGLVDVIRNFLGGE